MSANVQVMDEPVKISFTFTTGAPAEPALPVPSAGPQCELSAIASRVYDAMGPGTPMLTYKLIGQRSQLTMNDVVAGLDELQRNMKIVLVHRQGDIGHQLAFRVI